MKIRLVAAPNGSGAVPRTQRLTQRQFLRTLVGAAGLVGLAGVPGSPRPAAADFHANESPNRVDTNLRVQGYLTVDAGLDARSLEVSNGVPSIRMTDWWQTDPAGRFALISSGNILFLQRATAPGWAAAADLLVVDPSSNLGVGTRYPVAKLDVAGGLRVSGGGSFGAGLSVGGGVFEVGNGAAELRLVDWWQTAPAGRFRFVSISDQLLLQRATTADWSATAALLVVDGADNVGIGTASPEERLHLAAGGRLKIGSRLVADENGAFYAP